MGQNCCRTPNAYSTPCPRSLKVPGACIRPFPVSWPSGQSSILNSSGLADRKRLGENRLLRSTRLQHSMSGNSLPDVRTGAPGRNCHDQILTTFSYDVVAAEGWRSRAMGKDWHELARAPWISSPPESVHNRLLSATFARFGVSRTKSPWSTRHHPCWIWWNQAAACH